MSDKTVLIIYGSTTGQTKILATYLKEALETQQIPVRLENVVNCQVEILLEYSVALLGASTWGAAHLQEDFYHFDQKMATLNLSHLQAAAFGCGGDSWPWPCEGVYQIEERLQTCHARILIPALAVTDDVGSQKEDAQRWIRQLLLQID